MAVTRCVLGLPWFEALDDPDLAIPNAVDHVLEPWNAQYSGTQVALDDELASGVPPKALVPAGAGFFLGKARADSTDNGDEDERQYAIRMLVATIDCNSNIHGNRLDGCYTA